MANRDLNQEMDELKGDLNSLREDISSLVDAMREEGAERGRSAYRRAQRYKEEARERIDGAQERLGQEIEERPMTSILTAFGVGFTVGMLLDRRR